MRSHLRAKSAATAIVALALAGAPRAQRRPDIRLDTDPPGAAPSIQPALAVAGDAVFAAWADRRNGISYDVYFNRSLDGGATWLPSDVRLDTDPPSAGSSRAVELAVQGTSVYAVWQDSRNGRTDVYFNRSLDQGTTWLPNDVRLDGDEAGIADSLVPRLATADSAVYVVWQDARNGFTDVYFNRSLDRGSTWLTRELRIDTDAPGAAASGALQLNAVGPQVFVVWSDLRNRGEDVYFNRSLDRGATWLAADVRLDTDPPGAAASRNPQLAIAPARNALYVAWQDHRRGAGGIRFNRSLDGGATWLGSDVRLDRDPAASRAPRLASAGDAVYAVWHDRRNGADDIYTNRSLDQGTTWLAADVRLDTDPPGTTTSDAPVVAASGPGVFVAWRERRAGGDDIHFVHSPDQGTNWLATAIQLDADGPGSANSSNPRLAADGSAVSVLWQDSRNGTFADDIYFNVPFGALVYGAGCAGAGGIVPQLSGSGWPLAGATWTLDLAGALGGSFGAVVAGVTSASQVALPFLGGTLLVAPSIATAIFLGPPTGPGAGSFSLPLDLPLLPGLVGVNVNFQALLFDPGAAGGVSMSNAVELWIG
ncbi:MAG: sialidase family protein [Planctomycetota bacterium]